VFSSLFSSILAKVLIASMAVAAVGTGVGVVADGAVPGDVLYGLDRAMEQVAGLLDLLVEQLEGDGVVGEEIAAVARSIGSEPVPPVEVLPVEGQPGEIPVEAPPVEAPPITVPNPLP